MIGTAGVAVRAKAQTITKILYVELAHSKLAPESFRYAVGPALRNLDDKAATSAVELYGEEIDPRGQWTMEVRKASLEAEAPQLRDESLPQCLHHERTLI